MSNSAILCISKQQILKIAIVPVLQQVVSIIVCSLTNADIFGHYEIAKLFITGTAFELNNYCESYYHLLSTEAKKFCQRLIRKNTYRTKLDICIGTSRESNFSLHKLEEKCFCLDTFLKGELRIVSSSTCFVRLPNSHGSGEPWSYREVDSPIKCGSSSAVLLQGEEFSSKTFQAKVVGSIVYDRPNKGKVIINARFVHK